MITYAPRTGPGTTFPTTIGQSLEDFRRWIRSDDCPEHGRFTYFRGQVLFDMAAERVNAHSKLKTEVVTVLANLVRTRNLGEIHGDGIWYTDRSADLSNEPDGSFLTWQSLKSGRVVLIESADPDVDGDGIEYRGGPDWALEVVSGTSVVKDTQWLPVAYHAAGVLEYWLIDARGASIDFTMHRHRPGAYEVVSPDPQGWRSSELFGRDVRLSRSRDPVGGWQYQLQLR